MNEVGAFTWPKLKSPLCFLVELRCIFISLSGSFQLTAVGHVAFQSAIRLHLSSSISSDVPNKAEGLCVLPVSWAVEGRYPGVTFHHVDSAQLGACRTGLLPDAAFDVWSSTGHI